MCWNDDQFGDMVLAAHGRVVAQCIEVKKKQVRCKPRREELSRCLVFERTELQLRTEGACGLLLADKRRSPFRSHWKRSSGGSNAWIGSPSPATVSQWTTAC